MNRHRLALFFLLFMQLSVSSCGYHRMTDGYIKEYSHLKPLRAVQNTQSMKSEDLPAYFLIVNVNAPHINYTDLHSFAMTLQWGVIAPREPLIGHAWIVLAGSYDGNAVFFEGGHSGELGLTAPRYFDEVMRRASIREDVNPIQYLYRSLPDGYLEYGSGIHSPTTSALFPLTRHEFLSCVELIYGKQGYDFSRWSLCDHNCVTFVQAILSKIGYSAFLPVTSVSIPQIYSHDGEDLRLWSDARFSRISLTTVDSLEKWLYQQLKMKRALPAKRWYVTHFKRWVKGKERLGFQNENG